MTWNQCDQIGRFLKILGDRKSSKRSPNDWQLFGLFWKTSLLCKNCIGYFWKTFVKNWTTFFSNIWSHCLGSQEETLIFCSGPFLARHFFWVICTFCPARCCCCCFNTWWGRRSNFFVSHHQIKYVRLSGARLKMIDSVIRLDYFWKILTTNFPCKSDPKLLWQLYILTSGHSCHLGLKAEWRMPSLVTSIPTSVTRLGEFWNFLVTFFSLKLTFWDPLKNIPIKKSTLATF